MEPPEMSKVTGAIERLEKYKVHMRAEVPCLS